MYSLGEVIFIQGMHDLGNCKNSVGLKPKAKLRKDAKAPSCNIGTEGRMYSLGEMNFIQGMLNLGNCKNSVGLKPAKAQR